MTSPNMFIHSANSGHLDCLYIFTTIHDAARNRFARISLHMIIIISLEGISKNGIAHQGMSIFKILIILKWAC